MIVKFKQLRDVVNLPKLPRGGDAGIDLYVALRETLYDHDNKAIGYKYFTGVSVEFPKNHVGLLFPRSSVINKDLLLSNSIGVIDQGFRGEIVAVFKYHGSGERVYQVWDKCCQLVIIPLPHIDAIEIVDELSETERGEDGFGSTGK